MSPQNARSAALSPQQLEQLWAEHVKGEFETKDVEATLDTMTADAYGGRGKDELRRFYRDDFIPSWPADLQTTHVNRVVGDGQLVDELHTTFDRLGSLLPEGPEAPTCRRTSVTVWSSSPLSRAAMTASTDRV